MEASIGMLPSGVLFVDREGFGDDEMPDFYQTDYVAAQHVARLKATVPLRKQPLADAEFLELLTARFKSPRDIVEWPEGVGCTSGASR
jgi:hypothetical protein